jgi:hypothetical protein
MTKKRCANSIIVDACSPDFPHLRAIARETGHRLAQVLGLRSEPDSSERGPFGARGLSARRLCHETFKATCLTRPANRDLHKLYGAGSSSLGTDSDR